MSKVVNGHKDRERERANVEKKIHTINRYIDDNLLKIKLKHLNTQQRQKPKIIKIASKSGIRTHMENMLNFSTGKICTTRKNHNLFLCQCSIKYEQF